MMQNMDTKESEKIIVHVEARLEKLLTKFLAQTREDIKSMLAGLEQGDYESIRIFGHRMKGTGGSIGLGAITDLGRSLDQAAKDQNSEDIRMLLGEFSTHLECLEVVYQ